MKIIAEDREEEVAVEQLQLLWDFMFEDIRHVAGAIVKEAVDSIERQLEQTGPFSAVCGVDYYRNARKPEDAVEDDLRKRLLSRSKSGKQ